ncbi:MAG TPA: ribosome recycling factor [bacterium]|nr:ribosome recycling factor [bacterium]
MEEKKEKINYKELIQKVKPDFEEALEYLKRELAKIRTSRASPALVENLKVEVFGQKFPLKQLGTISVPQAREIIIQPWDSSYIEGIVKALENADLGVSPVVSGNEIRISLPPMTEEFRKNLLRIVSQKKEKAKKMIREAREWVWNQIQRGFREGRLSEDEKYKGKDELQDLVEEFNEKIEEMVEKKIEEIKS